MDWGWILLLGGGALAWFGYQTRRQAVSDRSNRLQREQEENDVALGTLGPIAAMLVTGQITAEQADAQVRQAAMISRAALPLWSSMSDEEKHELGRNMLELYRDPTLTAQQTAMIDELKAVDPELWAEAHAKAKRELGPTPTGGQA